MLHTLNECIFQAQVFLHHIKASLFLRHEAEILEKILEKKKNVGRLKTLTADPHLLGFPKTRSLSI